MKDEPDEMCRVLEPNGGNLYRAHPMMINSGQFWRCEHGSTGFGKNMKWIGCKQCELEDPDSYMRFHGKRP